MNIVCLLRSHSAKANMPRKRRTQASPQASQACTITSVSLLVRNWWPSACNSGISSW